MLIYRNIDIYCSPSNDPDNFKKPILSASLEFVFSMTLALLQNDNCYDNWYMIFLYNICELMHCKHGK